MSYTHNDLLCTSSFEPTVCQTLQIFSVFLFPINQVKPVAATLRSCCSFLRKSTFRQLLNPIDTSHLLLTFISTSKMVHTPIVHTQLFFNSSIMYDLNAENVNLRRSFGDARKPVQDYCTLFHLAFNNSSRPSSASLQTPTAIGIPQTSEQLIESVKVAQL